MYDIILGMKKVAFSFSLFTIFLFTLSLTEGLSTMSVAAGVVCQPIYGGGETCVQTGNILINKTVANPKTGAFVDNLSVNDDKFPQDQTVTFQLTVTNTGGAALSTVNVKDVFPQFVNFVAGPGNFDPNSKTLTFSLNNLNPRESRTFTLTAVVVNANELPADRGIVCVVNQAQASSNGQLSSDNAQFCIQKQVLAAQVPPVTKGGLKVFPPQPVTAAPPTGPEMLPLIGLLPTGIFGFFLRKKASK